MGADLLGLIEAAYRVDVPENEWLAGITNAGNDLFDRGLGTAAYIYSLGGDAEPVITRLALGGSFDPSWLAAFQDRIGEQPHLVDRPPVGWRSWMHMHAAMAASIPEMQPVAAAFDAFGGAKDVFAINGRDPQGFGVWVGVPQKKKGKITDEELELYKRVSAHLAAGYRIRRALGTKSSLEAAEAVLTPDGKIVHAVGEARDDQARNALRRAALALDRARSSEVRKDAPGATRIWRALVEGRWTLLDQFDSDGKRFVVAAKNDVAIKKPRPLSARERQVLAYGAMDHTNKEIAYALGLSAATVRVLIARASQKLGVRGRVDAIGRFRSLQAS
ncbi:MAG: LuxR C-terminal-related transcriptional regulator [Polyangiaceae bacterium]